MFDLKKQNECLKEIIVNLEVTVNKHTDKLNEFEELKQKYYASYCNIF